MDYYLERNLSFLLTRPPPVCSRRCLSGRLSVISLTESLSLVRWIVRWTMSFVTNFRIYSVVSIWFNNYFNNREVYFASRWCFFSYYQERIKTSRSFISIIIAICSVSLSACVLNLASPKSLTSRVSSFKHCCARIRYFKI